MTKYDLLHFSYHFTALEASHAVPCWDADDDLKTVREMVKMHRPIFWRGSEKVADVDADQGGGFEWNRRHGDFVVKEAV